MPKTLNTKKVVVTLKYKKLNIWLKIKKELIFIKIVNDLIKVDGKSKIDAKNENYDRQGVKLKV